MGADRAVRRHAHGHANRRPDRYRQGLRQPPIERAAGQPLPRVYQFRPRRSDRRSLVTLQRHGHRPGPRRINVRPRRQAGWHGGRSGDGGRRLGADGETSRPARRDGAGPGRAWRRGAAIVPARRDATQRDARHHLDADRAGGRRLAVAVSGHGPGRGRRRDHVLTRRPDGDGRRPRDGFGVLDPDRRSSRQSTHCDHSLGRSRFGHDPEFRSSGGCHGTE